jgi:hypothetical protein
MIRFLTRFLKYTFLGKIDSSKRIIEINEVNPLPERQPEQKPTSKEQIRNQLIVRINWVLMGVCIVSFVVIIIYALLLPGQAVPDIIQNAFFTTLGWFGGALGTFFEREQT